ncbi:hypothetical protein D0C36_09335 [Mucilaginibacter conchicola]|uniref:Uncharacterized protein n=1 Tax=Mucilaginibacter conchicola TaxID=2303333 RepID=A0A372P191_9SPHI|nr:hypothetical protein [Mucilaginibacter conchicola]RFZ95699.1 hypothetical protein D0C36_09335 [Mucilaginibacter conchicola]
MSEFRLDRSAFKLQSAKEAADHDSYYQKMPLQERAKVINYLKSVAYNYPEDNPPRLDRTAFSIRSRRSNG